MTFITTKIDSNFNLDQSSKILPSDTCKTHRLDIQTALNPKPFAILSAIYLAALIISNFASNKLTQVCGFSIDAGYIFFPLTYIINDIISETYGYQVIKRLIWGGLIANVFAVLAIQIVIAMPSDPAFTLQQDFMNVFQLSQRIFIASTISYLVGELLNAKILNKMKYRASLESNSKFTIQSINNLQIREVEKGNLISKSGTETNEVKNSDSKNTSKINLMRVAWRFIASTVIGGFVENFLFYILAFSFVWDWHLLFSAMIAQYIIKISVEILAIPLSCGLVVILRKRPY